MGHTECHKIIDFLCFGLLSSNLSLLEIENILGVNRKPFAGSQESWTYLSLISLISPIRGALD